MQISRWYLKRQKRMENQVQSEVARLPAKRQNQRYVFVVSIFSGTLFLRVLMIFLSLFNAFCRLHASVYGVWICIYIRLYTTFEIISGHTYAYNVFVCVCYVNMKKKQSIVNFRRFICSLLQSQHIVTLSF